MGVTFLAAPGTGALPLLRISEVGLLGTERCCPACTGTLSRRAEGTDPGGGGDWTTRLVPALLNGSYPGVSDPRRLASAMGRSTEEEAFPRMAAFAERPDPDRAPRNRL